MQSEKADLKSSGKYEFYLESKVEKSRIKALCRFQRQKAEKHRTATPSGTKICYIKIVFQQCTLIYKTENFMLCAWKFCVIQVFSSTYFYIKVLYQNKELVNLEENEMKRVCFYFPAEIIEMCDGNLSLAKAKSRNQFVIDAIKLYDCVLHKEVNTELLTPAFETVMVQDLI